ncbi:MAG: class I tRNA ligase family protein [Clostridia bacterium]|nr:class I tRNA ligase family protein [Clostridia bacterium]
MTNKDLIRDERPVFPKRAVITGGMPYGNKELHFGHIAGVFIHADMFARFLRDRIGRENVIFVSGTDCYGSPAMEGFRKVQESGNNSIKTIEEFVEHNHNKQVDTFNDYLISFNFFGASAFGSAKQNHIAMSEYFIRTLDEVGAISKKESTQFFDQKLGVYLNGRQVTGKCPIEGCSAEKGYADECDMGHQYNPEELINPISTLSGEKPILKDSTNLYFKLEDYNDILKEWVEILEKDETYRPYITKEIKEFLKKPEIYIKKDYLDRIQELKSKLGKFKIQEDNQNKVSFTLEYNTLKEREKACAILTENSIRFRTGKTLVPFRMTGNIEWGVPVPEIKGLKNSTFYVWPESLWAPISFSKTYLENSNLDHKDWRDWWCDPESKVYQFIGEDNIYFYGPAEMAMFFALQGKSPNVEVPKGNLQIPRVIANKHILFLNKKASSSGTVKPPMAQELLNYYTPEQLRAHFLGLGLSYNNASFMPKPLNPSATPNEADPVLREGNLLTNVFNRVIRTAFYSIGQKYDWVMPNVDADEEIMRESTDIILKYEKLMAEQKFHVVMNLLDGYIREINKYFVKFSKEYENDEKMYGQTLANTMQKIRTATILMHPIVPNGTELVKEYLNVNDKYFDWKYIFEQYNYFTDGEPYRLKEIPPRFDFFAKHPSQLEGN